MGVYTNTMRYTGTSGVDVESMVQAMMKAEGMKADRLFKQKTTLEWQQQAFRSLGNSVRTFRNNYLSFSSTSLISNMRSSATFSKKSISGTFSGGTSTPSSTDSSILNLGSNSTITASADLPAGDYSVSVKSVASAEKYVGDAMSSDATTTVALDPTKVEADDFMDLNINGTVKRITFTQDDVDSIAGDPTAFKDLLQTKIDSTFGTINGQSKVNATIEAGGELKLAANTAIGATFSIVDTAGVQLAQTVTTDKSILDGPFDKSTGKFYTDGTDSYVIGGQTIDVAFATDETATDYLTKLNDGITAAGITDVVASFNNEGKIVFNPTGDAKPVEVTSVSRNYTNGVVKTSTSVMSGVENTADNTFNADGLDSYVIGGQTVDVAFTTGQTKDDYLATLQAELTAKGLTDVTASLDADGKILFESTDGTTNTQIESVTRTVNGEENTNFTASGGLGTVNDTGFTVNGTVNGGVSMVSNIGFDATNLSSTFDVNAKIGTTGTDTIAFGDGTTLDIEITADTTFKDYMDAVNASGKATMTFNKASNSFSIESTTKGDAGTIDFTGATIGKTAMNIADVPTSIAKNSEVEITGPDGNVQTVIREDNKFSYNGITFNLDSALQTRIDNGEDITVDMSVSGDTDSVYDTIKGFIDDYNKLLGEIYTAVDTKHNREFQPLTSDEKQGLSESEVKDLEEKAKQGLLNRSPEFTRLSNRLREATNSQITLADGSTVSLASIGITTGDYSQGGKLFIDEQKLKEAISSDPDKLASVFTDMQNGVAEKLDDVINEAVGNEGYVTHKAGFKDSVYVENNYLSQQIERKQKEYDRMNDYLMDKENYYYKMFANMEKVINEANNQMAALMNY